MGFKFIVFVKVHSSKGMCRAFICDPIREIQIDEHNRRLAAGLFDVVGDGFGIEWNGFSGKSSARD